ncbi:hypothetical protein RCL1_002289 [Eukaryota sp. TZLM3-RCL]
MLSPLYIAISLSFFTFALSQAPLEVLSFSFINFTLADEKDYASYIESKTYEHVAPAGIKVYQDQLFVSFPRWTSSKTPATLAKYDNTTKTFLPFPSEYLNNVNNPQALKSVLGFEITPNGWMWILDQARIEGKPASVADVRLIIFDLKTNQIRRIAHLPSTLVNSQTSFLNDLVVDTDKLIAYIADSGVHVDSSKQAIGAIYAYNYENDVFQQIITGEAANSDETVWIKIKDQKVFDHSPMLTGADGIALSCDFSTLYFCPLTSRKLWSMDVSSFRNVMPRGSAELTPLLVGTKGFASDGLIVTSNNYLYLSDLESSRVVRTDLNTKSGKFLSDSEVFSHTSTAWPDTFAVSNGKLYVVTNQLHNWLEKRINFEDEDNFQILIYDLGDSAINSYTNGCVSRGFVIPWYYVLLGITVVLLSVFLYWVISKFCRKTPHSISNSGPGYVKVL